MNNAVNFSYFTHELKFIKPARTSRNVYESRKIWIVKAQSGDKTGYGEAGPLLGLSPDYGDDFENKLKNILEHLNSGIEFNEINFKDLPAIKFAVETALLDLLRGGNRILFPQIFKTSVPIPVNGLVWMENVHVMEIEALNMAEAGFDCVKIKIGAFDFDAECRMLERFSFLFPAPKYQIRLDANEAFSPQEAKEALKTLRRFSPHSIEQPIARNQWDAMAELCALNYIPIALDEELIGFDSENAKTLLKETRPHFIVLKPTLLGGFRAVNQWIDATRQQSCGWWITSALESNIGLNAIAQFAASKEPKIHQGLGTGTLYRNNFSSAHEVKSGLMYLSAKNPVVIPEQVHG